MMEPPITGAQRDAFGKLVNTAFGRAASALSELVGDGVRLSVSAAEFSDQSDSSNADMGGVDSVSVRQHFSGQVGGDILLIFPERRGFDLVRAMLGDQVPLDQLTDLEREVLLEIGNIVLNACLGGLADQLGLRLESSLPVYVRGAPTRVLSGGVAGELVLFLHIVFALPSQDIGGRIVLVMDIVSAQTFQEALRATLSRAIGA